MMRLFIEGRQVDLSENEVLQVTREIADIREPAQRSSDWSRTFRIPGTSANNKLFGHIFDVNQEQLNNGTQFAPDFNPNKKAAALVTVDEVEQVRGYVRLLNINVTRKGQIEYEVSVHGLAADLFAKIRNLQLSDIDLSEFNHTLNRTNIQASWNFTPASGYVYPMIDRNRTDVPFAMVWRVQDFYPAVFAKTLVDKIFTSAGFAYTSDSFFNTALFKKLVIPSPGVPQINEAVVTSRKARAKRNADAVYAEGSTIVFNDDSSGGYYDNGGNFDTATGKYNSPTGGGRFSVSGSITVNITGLSNVTYPYITMTVGVYVDGKLAELHNPLRMVNVAVTGATKTFTFTINDVYADKNEKIDLRIIDVLDYSDARMGEVITGGIITIKANSWIRIDPVQTSYGLDSTVDMNGIFSGGKWKQDEFLNSLVKMFNLYIEPTGRTNELYIAPRDTFYRDTVIHDLTAKIDYSQPMTITPMGELEGNPYVFTYAKGDDDDSKEYVDAIGTVYGEARIIVDNDLIKDERKTETIFASTPYSTESSNNFRIASMETAEEKAGTLRILYWSGKIGTEEWLLCDSFKFFTGPSGADTIEGYPHAGHLDDPFTPTIDLSFGMPAYVNLPAGVTYTNNNLFNVYWRKYLTEITDRNSRIVTARVYITPADWLKWSFRDLYFFQGQYFRLNKIQDYQVGESELIECEFLKIKTANVFTPQTGAAGGGYDIKDTNNDAFPNIRTRPIGKKKRFAWSTLGGSNEGGKGPVFDWTQGIVNLTYKDIGTPTTGDKFRPAIEWTGADWNIVLIQEV
jgi:hypothetical protein